ncbi:g3233 [Coccomyxa elongata]
MRVRSALSISTVCLTLLLAQDVSAHIRVQNGLFVDENCKEFLFSGYNAWQTLESALNMCCGNYQGLVNQFQEAKRQNFNVVRIFGFPVQKGFNLQTYAGVYNEYAFKGLDIVVAEAAKAGLKLIIALTNNWSYNNLQTDWKCSYTNWTSTARQCDDFFSDRNAIDLYKNHVKKVLTRINTVTGLTYGSDPTIFGWNLMNEPRSGKSNGAAEIQSWITEVAPYLKSFAPNQLVTVGEDGFYQSSNCQAAQANPVNAYSAWPLQTGQDFLPNHLVDGIDFASIHMWPDNWGRTDQAFGRAWLDAHMKDAWYLGKPVVIEEFGKAVGTQGGWMAAATETYANQYDYFKLAYDYARGSLDTGYGYKGIMFWRWASVDPSANNGGFDEAATITTQSGVFRDIIAPFSAKVAQFLANTTRPAVAGCTPLGGRPAAAAAPAPAPVAAAVLAPTPVPAVTPAAANGAAATAIPVQTTIPAALPAAAAGAAATPLVTPAPVAADAAATATDSTPAAPAGTYAWGNVNGNPAPVAQPTTTAAAQSLSTVSTSAGRRMLGETYVWADSLASSGFWSESTFSTPAGYTPYNINYKVSC